MESDDAVWRAFVRNVQRQLHVVFTINPATAAFANRRQRRQPSLTVALWTGLAIGPSLLAYRYSCVNMWFVVTNCIWRRFAAALTAHLDLESWGTAAVNGTADAPGSVTSGGGGGGYKCLALWHRPLVP